MKTLAAQWFAGQYIEKQVRASRFRYFSSNMFKSLENFRIAIAAKVRDLRIEHGWTQQQLGDELLLSQSRLSELERGGGSFTAEQLLRIMATFNVTTEHFTGPANLDDDLQNALARHGASHLREIQIVPGLRYENLSDLVNAALESSDSRQITALAPVLVKNAKHVLQAMPRKDDNRFWWVVENTIVALQAEARRPKNLTYVHAKAALETLMLILARPVDGETLLDLNIRSVKSLEGVKAKRSSISEKWHIITAIQPEDFLEALRAANDD